MALAFHAHSRRAFCRPRETQPGLLRQPLPAAQADRVPRGQPCEVRIALIAQRSLHRAHHRQAVGCRAAETQQKASDSWLEFCRLASGEWEGSSATFDTSGQPQELPPHYVPEAYREWGQAIYDWQTQSSTLAEEGQLLQKMKRLMPTVGCEADAVAFTSEDQVTAVNSGDGQPGPVCLENGSYSIPADFSSGSRTQAQHCFSTADEQRLRVVHVFRNLSSGWTLTGIEVHRERREGPYNGGKELAGCGGGMPAFAEKERLGEDALDGDWSPSPTGLHHAGTPLASARNSLADGIVRLPLGVWSAHRKNDKSLQITAGCLLSTDERYVSTQSYEDGHLKYVAIGKEQKP